MEKNDPYTKQFAERLNLALDHHAIPPRNKGRIQHVAEMFAVSHAGAGKWVNGLVIPAKKHRESIAQRLKINKDWLETGHGDMLDHDKQQPEGIMELPVLTFHEAIKHKILTESFKGSTVKASIDTGENSFAIYSKGTAMSGRFPEGTLLIFDPDQKANDGDYVLAHINKLPDAIFRQLVSAESGKHLYAQDPRYQTHKMTSGDKLLGKLVHASMSY